MGGAALAGAAGITSGAIAAGKREIKVAVVGCGGRGTGGSWKPANEQDFYRFGAIGNMLQAAALLRKEDIDVTVKPVAFADYFIEKARFAAETIRRVNANGKFDNVIYGASDPEQ